MQYYFILDLNYRVVKFIPSGKFDSKVISTEEIQIGESLLRYISDKEEFTKYFSSARKGVITTLQKEFKNPSGNSVVYSTKWEPYYKNSDTIESIHYVITDHSNSLQANIKPEESQARYITLAKNIPDSLILLFDFDFTILLAEGKELERLELTKEEFENKNLSEIFDLPTRELLLPLYKSALEGKKSSIILFYNENYFSVQTLPINNEQGDIIAGYNILRNITSQKEAEDKLNKSRIFIKKVTNMIPYLIFIYDLHSNKPVYINAYSEKLTGYTPQQIKAMGSDGLATLIPGESFNLRNNYHKDRIQQTDDNVNKQEVKIRMEDGTIRWVEITDVVFSWSPSGQPQKILGLVNDIHDRKDADLHLKKSYKELSDFKHALDIASIVSVADVEGNILYVNENFCKISGYSQNELVGKNHNILKSDYHKPAFFTAMWKTISKGKVWKGEILNKTKKGSNYWLYTYIIPFLDEHGKPFQYFSIRYDITKINMVKESLETSLKEKEILLSEIYHRVKNNLNVVVSLLALQANRFRNDKIVHEALNESKNRIYALALVHEKLYQSTDLYKINFKNYITDLIVNLIQAYKTGKEKIETDIKAIDIFLPIETIIPIGLILNELVSNTLKYGMNKSSEAKINVTLRHSENYTYILSYKDSGKGFSNKFNLDTSTSLGIKLVKALARQISGEVEFPHKGSSQYTINFKVEKK